MTTSPDPHDTERTVDRLEEKVFGHPMDQTRDEDEREPEPAQDAQGEAPGEEPTD